jgi:hypothetical protein
VLTPRVLRTSEDADNITDPQIKRMNYLRKLNSGDLNDAAFELLEEGDPTLDANPADPIKPAATPKANKKLPDPVKVPVEMLPELYRLHKELEARQRRDAGQADDAPTEPAEGEPDNGQASEEAGAK